MSMVWASRVAIREKIADVPENWLRAFAVRHPQDFRKFATTRNGSALYRVEAVLRAIEDGEGMPDGGIKDQPFDVELGAEWNLEAGAASALRASPQDAEDESLDFVASNDGSVQPVADPSARPATRATNRPLVIARKVAS